MNSFPVSLLFTLLALVLVLVLAWFAIRMLAQISGGKLRNGRVKVTHTVPLSARERLVLVEFDDQEYFLGVTANGISVIEKKPAAVVVSPDSLAR